MARPKATGLTDNELMIIKVLWEKPGQTIADILVQLKRKPKPVYTTILSAIQIMEKKGYLKHKVEGKAYLYSPLLKKSEYEKNEVKNAAKRISDGGALGLAINLVKNEHLSPEEIDELKKILGDL